MLYLMNLVCGQSGSTAKITVEAAIFSLVKIIFSIKASEVRKGKFSSQFKSQQSHEIPSQPQLPPDPRILPGSYPKRFADSTERTKPLPGHLVDPAPAFRERFVQHLVLAGYL
jgi:hypothetical protein